MTLSAVSNNVLATSHVSRQKTGTDSKQTENGRSNSSSGNKFEDNVTLGQSQKMAASSQVIDAKTAETLLNQTLGSILGHSKTAVSAQANTTPQVAQEILTEN
jgi:hypothetical protein